MKIYITRHGETEWNLAGRMQGQMDSSLSPLGIEQATWLGSRLKDVNIDVICSSTSGRALQTAELIRGERDIKVVQYENLREIFLGDWEGMLHDDIAENDPEDYNNLWHHPERFSPKNKESIEGITKRAGLIIDELIRTYRGQDILIVSHAMLLKGIFAYIKKFELSEFWCGPFMKATCLSIIEVDGDSIEFTLEGDVTHYQ